MLSERGQNGAFLFLWIDRNRCVISKLPPDDWLTYLNYLAYLFEDWTSNSCKTVADCETVATSRLIDSCDLQSGTTSALYEMKCFLLWLLLVKFRVAGFLSRILPFKTTCGHLLSGPFWYWVLLKWWYNSLSSILFYFPHDMDFWTITNYAAKIQFLSKQGACILQECRQNLFTYDMIHVRSLWWQMYFYGIQGSYYSWWKLFYYIELKSHRLST